MATTYLSSTSIIKIIMFITAMLRRKYFYTNILGVMELEADLQNSLSGFVLTHYFQSMFIFQFPNMYLDSENIIGTPIDDEKKINNQFAGVQDNHVASVMISIESEQVHIAPWE
jgi:hypothetical protein